MKILVLIFVAFFTSYPVISQVNKDLEEAIDKIIKPLMVTNNYSGTVLVSRDNKILFSKQYGKMNIEYDLDNNPDSKFFIASASMIFTSAAIMKLNEEGKLFLSDPLSKFLPDYKHGSKITINDLLAQRSGIPAIGEGKNVDYDSITKFEHNPEKLYSYFKDYDLLFEPGEEYNHSRSDYILLAYIIEMISGKKFGHYLRDEIFIPLKMENTGHYFNEKGIIPNLAKGYSPKDLYDLEAAYQIDWSSKTGHGSIYSTAHDLNIFTQAVISNKFLKKESWSKIFTDYGDKVGFGWFITKHLNRDRFQMNGRSPGFSSYIGIYPEEKLTIIVLSNIYVSLPAEIGKSIGAIVFNEEFEPLNLTNNKVPEKIAQKLTGTYKFDENFYIPHFELTFTYVDGNIISDWGGLIPIEKDQEFHNYILRTYWSSLTFIEDESGNIIELMYDDHKGVKKLSH